jgi:hypothetical protein
VPWVIAGPPCLRGHKYGCLVLQVGGWALDKQSSPVKRLLLRNPKRGGQGSYWAVEPYDDDDDWEGCMQFNEVTNSLFALGPRKSKANLKAEARLNVI